MNNLEKKSTDNSRGRCDAADRRPLANKRCDRNAYVSVSDQVEELMRILRRALSIVETLQVIDAGGCASDASGAGRRLLAALIPVFLDYLAPLAPFSAGEPFELRLNFLIDIADTIAEVDGDFDLPNDMDPDALDERISLWARRQVVA